MRSATYREVLKGNRAFRNLWTGQVISELGTWFSFIAELGLVRVFSGSALATTALMVARLLPYLLVAPFAGVIVDRVSRRRVMIATDLARAAVALCFLGAASLGSVWAVCLCSATMSSLGVFFDAAKNASIPNLVAPRELLTANVLMFSTRFLQFTLGSALGGITAAQFGYSAAFVVDSLSFVASTIFVAMIPASAMKKSAAAVTGENPAVAGGNIAQRAPGRFFSDLREGFAYIWATPFVRGVIGVNVGWALGGGMNNVLYDQIGGHMFAGGEGDRGDLGVATLFTAAGTGLFLGMLLARRVGAWVAEERRATLFIGWALIAHGIFFSMAGLMTSLAAVAICVAISRLIIAMEFGVQETLVMRVIPDHYRGRVFTTDRSLEFAVMTLSMTGAGWMLGYFSPLTMMIISGALSASPGAAWLLAVWLRRFSVPERAVRESYGD
ncbi:MAG TPA: MFS transporter [Blastocatellia bacterium]